MGLKFNPFTGKLDLVDSPSGDFSDVELDQGTAAAPSISFNGDPDTGIYSPGQNEVAISTNGTDRLVVDGLGNIGIGTDSPNVLLHLAVGTLGFGDISARRIAEIEGYREGGNFAGSLIFRTQIGNAPTQKGVERLRLTSTGALNFVGAGTEGSTQAVSFNGSAPVDSLVIDSDGRLLVGTSSEFRVVNTNPTTISPRLQLAGVGEENSSLGLFQFTSGFRTRTSSIAFARSQSGTVGGQGIVAENTKLGELSFHGSDGSAFVHAANIRGEVDGTPGANDMPGRLVFSVTADGASSPIEAMRIKNSRIINITNTPVYADNAAAKTGGLVDGDVYRTSTGDLKIVYT